MIAEISAGLTSLQATIEIVKTLQAGATATAINDVKFALNESLSRTQSALLAAQIAEAAALKRVTALEAEVAHLKNWEADRERYKLTRYEPGSVCYSHKPGMEAGEPPVRLCPNCYTAAKKSFLQPTKDRLMRDMIYRCADCGLTAPLGHPMADTDIF